MQTQLSKESGAILERRIEEAFCQAGWKVQRESEIGGHRPDLLAWRRDRAYVVEIKIGPEGRRDRLLPLLALAILQVQQYARHSPKPVVPLAIVGARRVSESLVDDVRRFAQEYAPGVAVGLIDLEGFQWFHGPGLESMNTRRERTAKRLHLGTPEPTTHLFSDLNQWMLKVLLAPQVKPALLAAPRGEYRNASELASAACVSVMSAFRFIRQLLIEGFLDEADSPIKLVRLEELLRRWQAANLRPAREVGVRWVIRGDPAQQIHYALRAEAHGQDAHLSKSSRNRANTIRSCLALFAAADAHGFGLVHGVAPHICLERLDTSALQSMGLSVETQSTSPDVYVRVPATRESVFRGAVIRNGMRVCDLLQVWLDTSAYPARGQEQSEIIYQRMLKPMLGKGSR